TKAAEYGDPKAWYLLGECHYYGMGGVDRDYARAVELYRRAAATDCAAAIYALGRCYEHGYGVKPDQTLARQKYHQAAAAGYAPARLTTAATTGTL
ncbi:MAG: hypothetical protein PHQ27_11175, partial [Victivallales bacterium]|nr:hypothetical protein [Victivallales bacterium]